MTQGGMARCGAKMLAILLACRVLLLTAPAGATISDLTKWTLVEDPAHPNFSASTQNAILPSSATLLASGGPIPAGTDIGYQTVDGNTPATSTMGYAFDPTTDFSLAIDFDWTFPTASLGQLAIGFGLGEDGDGVNSAGAVMVANDGAIVPAVAGGARVGDADYMTPLPIGPHFGSTGSFFASFDAATGSVTLGIGAAGAVAPAFSNVYVGIQDMWDPAMLDDKLLLASFFLRSDDVLFTPWQSGSSQAIFSNFRILEGEAVRISQESAVPEPGTGSLALLALAFGLSRRRYRRQV